MKTRAIATVVILLCWFALAPDLVRADDNEWYQGQQGQWQHHGHSWRWGSSHGDDWYQGHQGHWYQESEGPRWYSNDGGVYRRGRSGWRWQH